MTSSLTESVRVRNVIRRTDTFPFLALRKPWGLYGAPTDWWMQEVKETNGTEAHEELVKGFMCHRAAQRRLRHYQDTNVVTWIVKRTEPY